MKKFAAFFCGIICFFMFGITAYAYDGTVSVSISCPDCSDSVDIDFNLGESSKSIIKRADNKLDADLVWSGSYISGIRYGGVTYQFGSNGSGLDGVMYFINGISPSKGVDSTYPEDGDMISVEYTDDYTGIDFTQDIDRFKKPSKADESESSLCTPIASGFFIRHNAGGEWHYDGGISYVLGQKKFSGWTEIYDEAVGKNCRYYFDSNGYALTGWNWLESMYGSSLLYCYYFDNDGKLCSGRIDGYSTDPSGRWAVDGKAQSRTKK